ncbi:uncharacterized protein LOC127254044 isoform X2 [Andrographis paniculata]|uniref:uncharacterized protein LOC127254044 isoform X2 n=1 Tax=Andrographis paniculata TaxID=175694 RepID=UPI0021E72DAF|nr:uncharacterized protein LOC127254044 isoform X2 [Andrographis paniculata]
MEMEISGAGGDALDLSYRPLPPVYFTLMVVWILSSVSWTFNTYRNNQFQPNKLQWMLASVPWIKALQLLLSFLFWYSCLYTDVCSLWMSFGVYTMGVLVKICAFVSFFLISHGYCITCHRLSLSERRSMASLGCIFYLTLVGFRASLPYFSVLLLLNYLVLFYVIFNHISHNLDALREQLSFIEDEDIRAMHDAVYTKYIMFKKFQVAMHYVAVLEIAIFISLNNSLESYWVRMLVRECAQFIIFTYIGWVFRSQELAPRFSVMPALRSEGVTVVPPIYSIEMDAETFKEFGSHEWHIGVPTLPCNGSVNEAVLVVIRQPHTCSSDSLANSQTA